MNKGDIIRLIDDNMLPDQLMRYKKGDLFKVITVSSQGNWIGLMHIKTARLIEKDVLAYRFKPVLRLGLSLFINTPKFNKCGDNTPPKLNKHDI